MRVRIAFDKGSPDVEIFGIEVSGSAMEAVGFTFNVSGSERVSRIKALSAALITEMEILRNENPAAARHASIAITDLETAQMRAVKAATWIK